jgi:hypothetical protein
MDGDFSNQYRIVSSRNALTLRFVYVSLHIFESYILLLRKNNTIFEEIGTLTLKNNIYFNIKLLSMYIMFQRIQVLPDICWHFCNALPIGYQRIYMRCIISLQRPKTQRILNPLVGVLATPIWTFRYRYMRCCKGSPVVVIMLVDEGN